MSEGNNQIQDLDLNEIEAVTGGRRERTRSRRGRSTWGESVGRQRRASRSNTPPGLRRVKVDGKTYYISH